MVQRIEVGVLGKHPGYGDFIRHGIADETADTLMAWIDETLTQVRDQMKADWADFWDNGQELRFWIGRKVLGKTTIGIFQPSRDRVGRRYPLLLLAQGVAVEAPVIDSDQRPWDVLSSQMARMQPGQGAAALLRGVDADALFLSPEPDAADQMGPVIWAHHPEGNLAELLASAAPVDHGRAATQRSYWWSVAAPGRAPVWLAHPDLPQGQALAWAIGGEVMTAPVPTPAPAAAPPMEAPSADPGAYTQPQTAAEPDFLSDPFADIPAEAGPAPMPEDAFQSARLSAPNSPDGPAELPLPDNDVIDDTPAERGYGEVTDYGIDLPKPLEGGLPKAAAGEASEDDWSGLASSDIPSLAMPRDDDPKSK